MSKLTLIGECEDSKIRFGRNGYCLYRCDCGTEKIIRKDGVESGAVISCGCSKKNRLTKHGKAKTRVYIAWLAVIKRCTNENDVNYPSYGGRGISVCERWLDFACFYEDMGDAPDGMSLDRIDNSGGYSKENCRWTTDSIQGYNQRKNSRNTSGKTGVQWSKRKSRWFASITVENKHIHLGSFINFEDAVAARKVGELKYFGFNKE